ncbi:Sulfur carrier protein FdhD [anaerobic digester metagenome]
MKELNGIEQGIITRKYYDGKWHDVILSIPKESPITVYVNGEELVTIICTPVKTNFLVLGYLYEEGIIDEIEDISALGVCDDNAIASVRLKNSNFKVPKKKIITSGCGGGIIFSEDFSDKIDSKLRVSPDKIFKLMKMMLGCAENYHESGGIHASALCSSETMVVMGEDIGRHNTIDKIAGECIFRKISMMDKILITTGRISSEMLRQAVKMKIPIIASLTSPTEAAVRLADKYNVTLAGYVRNNKMTLYSNSHRLTDVENIEFNSDSQLAHEVNENYGC